MEVTTKWKKKQVAMTNTIKDLLPKFYNFAINKTLQLNKQKYSFLKNEPLMLFRRVLLGHLTFYC